MTGTKQILKLDPRTKLFLLVLFNIAIFNGYESKMTLLVTVMPMLLMYLAGGRRKTVALAILCLISGTLIICCRPALYQGIGVLLAAALFLFYGLMPVLVMGAYVMTTTTPGEFSAAMLRLHIPMKIIIPFAVLLRFFPTIVEEARSINMAMRMRGIMLGGKHPGRMLEYRLVPLLMSTVKIGDELSAAAMTRCIDAPGEKTSISEIGFHVQDFVSAAVGVGLLILVIAVT
jgi:energy-coupling factor transport system permease protein